MLLPEIAPGSVLSQRFGPALAIVAALEPAMWVQGDRAYWVPFTGAHHVDHMHPGEDYKAAEGTAVVARESGIVTLAGPHNAISGTVVQVEIQPGVSRYGANHLRRCVVHVGDEVERGQKLGEIGHTGSVTGNSTHTYLELFDRLINLKLAPRGGWVCWNPALFSPGGKLANDPRVQPLGAPPVVHLVTLKGPGINIRITPDLDVGVNNLFATSRADGIFAYPTGKQLHPHWYTGFQLQRTLTNDDGAWVQVTGFHRTLYIHADLVTIH